MKRLAQKYHLHRLALVIIIGLVLLGLIGYAGYTFVNAVNKDLQEPPKPQEQPTDRCDGEHYDPERCDPPPVER